MPTRPAEDFSGLGANAECVCGAIHIIDAEVVSLGLEDCSCIGCLNGRWGGWTNEFGRRLFSLGQGFGEVEVVKEIVGLFRARSDFDEPHANPAGLISPPDVLFGPSETRNCCRTANGARDLPFFAVEPVAIGGERGEGGGTAQFAVEIEGIVAAEDPGEGPARIAQGIEEGGEELSRGHGEDVSVEG